ncbi:hypothetical protein [Phytohabitans kaempferiae]|uniref:Uncharacterized protein n=1 Tax=Phytohabitans kaempferiae TaxID=1620943 RepID=A0ABV6MHS7_9ACTN
MTKLGRLGKLAFLSAVTSGALLASTAAPAHAAWSTFAGQAGTAVVMACKTAVDGGGFGPLWEITLVAATTPGRTAGARFEVRRGSSLVSRVDLAASNGSWDVKTTWASRILGDRYTGTAGTGLTSGEGAGGAIGGSFSSIANC